MVVSETSGNLNIIIGYLNKIKDNCKNLSNCKGRCFNTDYRIKNIECVTQLIDDTSLTTVEYNTIYITCLEIQKIIPNNVSIQKLTRCCFEKIIKSIEDERQTEAVKTIESFLDKIVKELDLDAVETIQTIQADRYLLTIYQSINEIRQNIKTETKDILSIFSPPREIFVSWIQLCTIDRIYKKCSKDVNKSFLVNQLDKFYSDVVKEIQSGKKNKFVSEYISEMKKYLDQEYLDEEYLVGEEDDEEDDEWFEDDEEDYADDCYDDDIDEGLRGR